MDGMMMDQHIDQQNVKEQLSTGCIIDNATHHVNNSKNYG